jgi:NAD-dependent SIR2 family protein deacetylase
VSEEVCRLHGSNFEPGCEECEAAFAAWERRVTRKGIRV